MYIIPFYNDVEFCQSCYDSMTPEERAQELLEAEQYENESFAGPTA